jgi:hypothetical protein
MPPWLINVLIGLVPAILVAFVTAVTTVFLALRRFRQERWWDRKAAMKTRTTQTSRRSHFAATAHRHLLRPRRQGQRPILRPQTLRRETVECGPHRHLKLWIYDLPPTSDYGATGRTNKHFTLKENPLKRVRSASRTCPASLDTLKVSVPPAVMPAPPALISTTSLPDLTRVAGLTRAVAELIRSRKAE